jgi:hypothetical protein
MLSSCKRVYVGWLVDFVEGDIVPTGHALPQDIVQHVFSSEEREEDEP